MDCFKITHDTALIFDFDGTMCRLFKRYDLKGVSQTLHGRMQKYGVDFSVELDAYHVFMEIVRQTERKISIRERALREADRIIIAAELEAVRTGEPVKGVETVLSQLIQAGYTVGIATNNSVECIEAFLKKYCSALKVPVVGRIGTNPERMKPDPWSVEEVLRSLNCRADNAVLIGDSQRDFDCARRAGCQFIGMAATEIMRERLMKLTDADHIVSDYFELKDRFGIC